VLSSLVLEGAIILGLDVPEALFVATAFLFQVVLIAHFALRKFSFSFAMRYGWIVYLLSLPAAVVSILLLLCGTSWTLWLGGFIYLVWAAFGFTVEYVRRIRWRNPARWPIFTPYVGLYLTTIMFYWWPLGLIRRPLWYVYGLLFIASTALNVTSHKARREGR
jgi:hypothetical protein